MDSILGLSEQEHRIKLLLFIDSGSLNDPQIRLVKSRLRIALLFIISVRAEKFSLESKVIPRCLKFVYNVI